MKKQYPKINEDDDKRFNFIGKAGIIYRFKIEAAKRGMSAGKLLGLIMESYVNSLDN